MAPSAGRPPPPLSREESEALQRKRRARNIAMLIALLAFCALFYVITLVKLGQQ
jgi:hypothetical protein